MVNQGGAENVGWITATTNNVPYVGEEAAAEAELQLLITPLGGRTLEHISNSRKRRMMSLQDMTDGLKPA